MIEADDGLGLCFGQAQAISGVFKLVTGIPKPLLVIRVPVLKQIHSNNTTLYHKYDENTQNPLIGLAIIHFCVYMYLNLGPGSLIPYISLLFCIIQ